MRHRKKLIALATLLALPFVLHGGVSLFTRLPTPEVATPPVVATIDGDVRRTPHGWFARRGVNLAWISGSAEEIGAQHSALLGDKMIETERVVWDGFAELVPFHPARTLMFDIGRVQYRNVAASFPDDRRREIAAEARGFSPDPFASELPTYQRMVMLHALYDISLGFEHSPLLGCTAFGLGPATTADGHALFARVFDFEAAEVFDREKVVFAVHENGKIPFASVAWPGFVGVVTGMNAEGVGIAVNGGRARDPSTTGVPVAFSLRETLQNARTTEEAVAILSRQPVMVSHIVFVGDAAGHFAVVERAPDVPAFVRAAGPGSGDREEVTNHFEGPLASDAKNERVRATTTTTQRRSRIDELLAEVQPGTATVASAVAIERDHQCAGATCAVGDRRAIDAFIATHGIVADLTARTLWVSEGPRLSGKFVKVDPSLLVQRPDAPPVPVTFDTLPEDPALHDGRYEQGRANAGGPLLHPDHPKKK